MSYNSKLRVFLGRIKQSVADARDSKDLQGIFSQLRKYTKTEGQIDFQNTGKWMFAAISLLAAVSFGCLYYDSIKLREYLEMYVFAVAAILGVGMIVPVVLAFSNNSKISEISDMIFNEDILFDNRLSQIGVDGREETLYDDYNNRFGDFERGDEDQEIARLLNGSLRAEGSNIGYQYYKFHYVRVYYVPVSNGKTTTMQRQTEDLYRYGLIMDFKLAKNIAVISSGGSFSYSDSWKTSSEEFNGIFNVYTDDKQSAAKLLKPSVVLAFIELSRHLDDLNVEINENGEMNISFSEEIVFDIERKHSITEVDEFEKEISAHRKLTKLDKLIEFVVTVYKHNDNNF